jgi:hypothetical protein
MALSRYRNLNTLEGNKYLETTKFPTLEQLNKIDTFQIVANKFDRLDNLAHIHLGDGQYWWILALFNDIDWAYNIAEGQILKIPTNLDEVLKLF